jgi:hypothetical protein
VRVTEGRQKWEREPHVLLYLFRKLGIELCHWNFVRLVTHYNENNAVTHRYETRLLKKKQLRIGKACNGTTFSAFVDMRVSKNQGTAADNLFYTDDDARRRWNAHSYIKKNTAGSIYNCTAKDVDVTTLSRRTSTVANGTARMSLWRHFSQPSSPIYRIIRRCHVKSVFSTRQWTRIILYIEQHLCKWGYLLSYAYAPSW